MPTISAVMPTDDNADDADEVEEVRTVVDSAH